MSFFDRLLRGLAFFAAATAVAQALRAVGATAPIPPIYVVVNGNRFRIDATVTRES